MTRWPRTGQEARECIRSGRWRSPTAPLAPGFVQANLVVLPADVACDFAKLCARNPRPLPLLERMVRGSAIPERTAANADLRTDLPRYRVYRCGNLVEERTELLRIWQPDWVAFLLGCSFTFDGVLVQAGIRVQHMTSGRNVPMYITNRRLQSAGRLRGPLVVSMRPIHPDDVARVCALTDALPLAHGGPISIGKPEALGVDLESPDFGDPPVIQAGDIPLFWACGVTAQAVATTSDLPLMITHAPGHMFVTDLCSQGFQGVAPRSE